MRRPPPPVPDRLTALFGDPWLRNAVASLERLGRDVGRVAVPIQLALRGKGARYAPHLNAGDVADYLAEAVAVLREARETLAAAVPLAVCGACAGRGCGACGGSGWLPAGGAE